MEDSRVFEHAPPFRWGARDLIAFILFFSATALFLPLAAFLIIRVFQPSLRFEDLSGVQLILIQALMDIAWVAFILFLIRGLHGRPSLRVLHFLPVGKPSVGRLIAGGAFLALAVLGASIVLPRPAESPLEKLLATTPSLILFVFFAIVVGPLLEEIVFRGFLFTALADVFGVRVAVPVTALLFAGLHGRQLGGNLPVLALILVVGYILTRVRERSNSIVPSIIMHTTYNATLFVVPGLASVLGFDPAP